MPFRILLFLLIFTSCASDRPEGKTEAEVLYREAKELVDDGRYMMATEKLNEIKSQYPYSYYATHAELLLADILFQQESYAEAAAAYLMFKDFHPKHEKLSYVIWMIAESNFNQLPSTADRDLSAGFEAIKYYKELLNLFPKSEYAKGADKKIKECQAMIEEKEKYIADFYFRTGVYDSARSRYISIIENFENKDLRDYSMLKIVESSLRLNKPKDCISYFQKYERIVSKNLLSKMENLYQQCKNSKVDE